MHGREGKETSVNKRLLNPSVARNVGLDMGRRNQNTRRRPPPGLDAMHGRGTQFAVLARWVWSVWELLRLTAQRVAVGN
jgi:hypothetical protein